MATVLLLASLIVILCIAGNRLSSRLGVPALFLFIALGMLFGSDGLFRIPFDNYVFAEQICSVALIFIMFYGGFGTNWKAARPVAVQAALLSSLGTVLTAALTGVFCYFVLRFPLLESFLIGAVISSTDAASVFAILRGKKLNLRDGTASLLEVESGSNDPFSYMLTVVLLSFMSGGESVSVPLLLLKQVAFGLLGGVVTAVAALFILRYLKFVTAEMRAVFIFAVAVLSYALPAMVGGNGYLSAYLAGILLGNRPLKHKVSIVHFFDGITNLAQIIVFFLLGLLAFPSQLPHLLLPALLIALFLTFVARPAAVFAILSPFRRPVRQQLLVSWAGLRGAASIVFAIMVTVSEAFTDNDIFHIVFCIVLLSIAFQGTLLPVFAKKLRMVDDESNVLRTFNDYQEESQVQFIQLRIPSDEHPWAGRALKEVVLPPDTLLALIQRDGKSIVPRGHTRLLAGDLVVLSAPRFVDVQDVRLQEMTIDKSHEWADKTLRELDLPPGALVVMIRRESGSVVPRGKTRIQVGDVLVLNGYEET